MFSLLVTVLLATRPRPVGGGATSLYDFTLDDIDGKPVSLAQFKGKALLIVNVASRCGFTYQYAGLEALYRKYRDRGFVVLGFPANNFFGQEPGSDAEIRQFCSATYAVSFPMFSKISVRGRDMHPLYRWLTSRRTNPGFAGAITWNFNKFLVGRDGRVVARLRTRDEPESDAVSSAVEAALR
jgi:glutathione peroxidase